MEKQPSSNLTTPTKVKLLCSYGGKIQPRPTDHQLSYIGGDTKLLAVDRNVKFSEISTKLMSLSNNNNNNRVLDLSEVSIKYQLPGEDLDALVSLIDDEDVEHMMVEYDRMQRVSAKPARLRLFIFDLSGPTVKTNVKETGPVTPSNPDYLFGFDKEYQPSIGPPVDLLQIPGMVLPENYGFGAEGKNGISESGRVSNVNVGVNGVAASGGGAQAVYRIPVVATGGVFQTGQFAYGVVTGMGGGNREQPVYNFVPVTPDMKVNQLNYC